MKTVPLRGAKAAGRVALVDDADYDLVVQYRWRVSERKRPGHRTNGPYATTWIRQDGRKVGLLMHKLITGYRRTDHVNHDGLDNQRSNLRQATVAQNTQNSRSRVGTSSQYKGVYWATRERAWRASIKHHEKTAYLGTFNIEKDAALAYDAAARELFGEYAALNFPQVEQPPPLRRQPPKAKAKRRAKPQPRGYDWMQAALRKQRQREGERSRAA